MITLALSILLFVVIIATGLALVDCWIRGRYMFEYLREERALLDAGFVSMAKRASPRVRQRVGFETLATPARAASRAAARPAATLRPATDRPHSPRCAPGAA